MLDTHVLVWWAAGEHAKLSSDAKALLYLNPPIDGETQSPSFVVSSITAWEIAQLVHCGRLHLALDVSTWLARAETIPGLVFVPVDTEIAVKSVELPGVFHKDPADRIIVATARKYAATIVTADAKILAYPHVQTVW